MIALHPVTITRIPATLKRSLIVGLSCLVCACGGGGSGDEVGSLVSDTATIAINPLVGVWDLPDDWNGGSNDEAYLVINSPDGSGEAEAIIFDRDDSLAGAEQSCFNIDGFAGTVTQSLTDELFLTVTAFPSAIVSLQPNGFLEISELSETDGSPERQLIATPLGIAQEGIPLCS